MNNMPFGTPMICDVAGRVFYHTDAQPIVFLCLPVGSAPFATVLRFLNGVPVDCFKQDIAHSAKDKAWDSTFSSPLW